MADPYDSDRARHAFAVERSQVDAESSNATARTTAQASILINGGAATAVLAFLAKEPLPQSLIHVSAVCLALYSVGVLAGTCMMYCTVRSLDYYSLRWRLEAHPEPGADAKRNRTLGEKWWRSMKRCFYMSMATFIFSSVILAGALFCSKPIEQSASASATTGQPSAQIAPVTNALTPH
jgi:hypothetical protein